MSNPVTLRSARLKIAPVAIAILFFISGCYERTVEGTQATYRFSWWLAPAFFVGCFLAVPIGCYLWKAKWTQDYAPLPSAGLILMICPIFFAILIGPSTFLDQIIIDDDHVETRFGMWFEPKVYNIRFDELRDIRQVLVPGNRGVKDENLRFVSKSGETIDLPASGDLIKHTIAEILERAKARGVPVIDDTN